MVDHNFYKIAGPFKAQELAEHIGATLSDPSKADVVLTGMNTLDHAGGNECALFHNRKYIDSFKATKAAVCIVSEDMVSRAPEGVLCLVSAKPYRAYAKALSLFYPQDVVADRLSESYISPEAQIDSTAQIGENCHIESNVVIRKNVKVGNNTKILSGAVINEGVEIGDECHIDSGVYITHTLMGNNVKVYPNTTLGKTGFGFDMDESGFVSVPQVGRLIIEDHVEIGANCNIDRGSLDDTRIGMGTRLDSLVQFGHNVSVGKGCVIVSQVGIAGSAKLGNYVMVGGQSGVAGHIKIGDGAKIAAQTGIMRNVDAGETIIGSPGVPFKQWQKQTVTLERLAKKPKKAVKGD